MVSREVHGQHVFLVCFLLHFRLKVGCEIRLFRWSWNALLAYVVGLGLSSRPLWALMGCLSGYVGGLGPILEPMFGVLSRLGPALRGYAGGLGPFLGPM